MQRIDIAEKVIVNRAFCQNCDRIVPADHRTHDGGVYLVRIEDERYTATCETAPNRTISN